MHRVAHASGQRYRIAGRAHKQRTAESEGRLRQRQVGLCDRLALQSVLADVSGDADNRVPRLERRRITRLPTGSSPSQ